MKPATLVNSVLNTCSLLIVRLRITARSGCSQEPVGTVEGVGGLAALGVEGSAPPAAIIAAAADKEVDPTVVSPEDLSLFVGVEEDSKNLLGLSDQETEVLALTGVELKIALELLMNVLSYFEVSFFVCSVEFLVTEAGRAGFFNGPIPRPANGLLLLKPLILDALKLELGV